MSRIAKALIEDSDFKRGAVETDTLIATVAVRVGDGETVEMSGNWDKIERITKTMVLTDNEWFSLVIESAHLKDCMNCGEVDHVKIGYQNICVVCGKGAK